MMYSDKFVCAVKSNGKVLREIDNAVLLPFSSEYCISLKNLNSRRAVASISIDGVDVLNEHRIIVEPGETCDLEGYMDSAGNITHKFKFIEKTAKISEHRGDRSDDGLLRVEFRFEAEQPEVKTTTHYHYDEWRWYPPYITSTWPYYPKPVVWEKCNTSLRGSNSTGKVHTTGFCSTGQTHTTGQINSVNTLNSSTEYSASVTNSLIDNEKGCDIQDFTSSSILRGMAKDGITVKGSSSNQHFKNGWVGKLEVNSHVIVLQLKGVVGEDNRFVKKAIHVDSKLKCDTCGTVNKSNSKFCRECGTSLI